MSEILYDKNTLMTKGYPKIKKLGACSPNGEMTPFMWKGRLMRLELIDETKGVDTNSGCATIRDVEAGTFLSYFAEDSYFHSAFVEGDTVYVTGVDKKRRDTIRIYESRDLVNWTSRDLLTNPEWIYFNSQIAGNKEVGYYIILESGPHVYPAGMWNTDYPKKHIGTNSWTMFFAKSPDLVNWEFLDYDTPFSKDIGTGGPCLKYSDGWFYLLADCLLPRQIFVNYMYRTKDFKNWYVGYYNPIMMPSDDDRQISPRYTDVTDEERERLKTAFHVNNTDLDVCDWNGKTYINFACGNQMGNYWMAEAVCDMPLADFFKHYFNE